MREAGGGDPGKEVLQAVARGTFAPVYLLYGDEPAAIREVVEAIRRALIPPDDAVAQSMAAFNHERFDGADVRAASQILDACAQVPMLAKVRLVELQNPDDLGRGGGKDDEGPTSSREGAIDALVRYVEDPSPTTVLVISGTAIDGRSRLVSAVKKRGVVVKFEALKKDEDGRRFAADEARARGRELSPDAAHALVAAVGLGRSEILAALERVALYAGERRRLELADVEAVVAPTREADIFALTDAVGRGDFHTALAQLAQMFPAGEKDGVAHQIFAMLIRQIRLLMIARANPRQVGDLAGLPPFIARKIEEQAGGMSMERLRRAYAALARLDSDLKGGSALAYASPYMALQRWILEACDALPGVAPRV